MSVRLTTGSKNSLVLAINDSLTAARTLGKTGVSFTRSETIIELNGCLGDEEKKSVARILDDGGLRSFVEFQTTLAILRNGEELNVRKVIPVTEYNALSNTLEVSKQIVECLSTHPMSYLLSVEAAPSFAILCNGASIDISLSSRLKIVSEDKLPNGYSRQHPNALINEFIYFRNASSGKRISSSDEKRKSLFFLYRTSGCISDRFDPKLFREFYDELRAFYGLVVSSGIFYEYGFNNETIKEPSLAHTVKGNDSLELHHAESLASDLVKVSEYDTSLNTDRRVTSGSSLHEILAPVIKMFNSKDNKYKTAAIWLLRAYISQRPMDRVLESTIALEVLLGDRDASDRIGLSKLMANRCAYALSKSNEERRSLMDFFVKFYKLRSDIVHSGTFNISQEDEDIVQKGIDLASRMLLNEINLETTPAP
jgi:hypothetical protein